MDVSSFLGVTESSITTHDLSMCAFRLNQSEEGGLFGAPGAAGAVSISSNKRLQFGAVRDNVGSSFAVPSRVFLLLGCGSCVASLLRYL